MGPVVVRRVEAMCDVVKKARIGRKRKVEHASDAVRESVAKAFREHSDEIAEGLLGKCKEGNVQAIKLGYELASENKELVVAQERKAAPKRSLATEWANEPEWTTWEP
jgi:hypothetical protein